MELSTQDILEILAATPAAVESAAERLSGITPNVFDVGQLKRMTAEGFLDCDVIAWNGVTLYVIWTHQTADGGLHVNAAVQMTDGDYFEILAQAIDGLAGKHRSKYVRFTTKRPGLVAKAEAFGYRGDSLVMLKHYG